jgi:hypothetical protein
MDCAAKFVSGNTCSFEHQACWYSAADYANKHCTALYAYQTCLLPIRAVKCGQNKGISTDMLDADEDGIKQADTASTLQTQKDYPHTHRWHLTHDVC